MCLRVDANGNGEGTDSHVSVFVYLMRGEHDNMLKWPFRGRVIVRLLPSCPPTKPGEYKKIIHFHTKSPGSRVLVSDRSSDGFGFAKFISHKDLEMCGIPASLRFRICAVHVSP